MSNALRFDPLLVCRLAEELDQRLRGRECAAAPFFAADRSVSLALRGREELRAELHPSRGFFRILPAPDDDDTGLDAVIERVSAPTDERVLEIHLREEGRFRSGSRSIVFELATNQWNVIVRGDDGRIVSVLNARRSGERSLYAGVPYLPPPGVERFGAGNTSRDEARDRWEAEVVAAEEKDRPGRLLAGFAWTGAINGLWILGGPDSPSGHLAGEEAAGRSHSFDAEAAFERWWWIRGLPAPTPAVLRTGGRAQPYPVVLTGVPHTRYASLLDAMSSLAVEVSQAPGPTPPSITTGRATALIQARLNSADRRLERLRSELTEAGSAGELRQRGDLLLARMYQLRRGEPLARLDDWEGRTVEFEIDPRLSPAENAAKFYEEARRRERAAERLPELIGEAETEVEKWQEAAAETAAGRLPEWIIERLARRDAASQKLPSAGKGQDRDSLPYRTFRTFGGLEVRVGRGAKENDRLTFGNSAPNDIWLHVQGAPGSHVILRWKDASAAPPARDLAEAAQLAAVFSRARTSSLVAVDWTRRKHVRKPRGAPPGMVAPQQVKTVFVEPDPGITDRLAVRE